MNDEQIIELSRVIARSLGFEDNTPIYFNRKFKDYKFPVEKLDLLEIFRFIGINPTELKPYIGENSLTDKGRKFLRGVASYAEGTAYPYIFGQSCLSSINALGNSHDLDTLAQNVTLCDFVLIRDYLDSCKKNVLEPHHL